MLLGPYVGDVTGLGLSEECNHIKEKQKTGHQKVRTTAEEDLEVAGQELEVKWSTEE